MLNKNDVIFEFEYAYNHNMDISEPLFNLSQFITFSVFKKIYEKTGSDEMRIMRIECKQGINTLDKIGYTSDKSEYIGYDDDGNILPIIKDENEYKNFNSFIHAETLGDGYDILQEASIIILEECKKHMDKYGYIDLLMPYTVRKLDKHVVIRKADSPSIKEVETTPLRNIFQNVRKYIRNLETNKSELNNPYSYFIDDEMTDKPEYDGIADKTIYRRIEKFSIYIDDETDINGKHTVETVDKNGYTETENKISELKKQLSPVQKDILKYRLQGKGIKAIATYMDRSTQTIKVQLERIRKKAVEMGIKPENV